jgi:triacylglycerol lipase
MITVATKLRSAIVLVPGLFGFDEMRVGRWILGRYFPEIPEILSAAGNQVLVARVFPTLGIAERAQQLKTFIDTYLPGQALHLIGHSMGGLDCRYLISRLGMADYVQSLTTVGAPHRGTVFADWCTRRLERLVRPLLQHLGIPYQAFYDLTTERCLQFNEEVPNAPQVRYFSVAGQAQASWRTPQLRMSQGIVTEVEGPNDGLVSVASAAWGEQLDVWDCDHYGLVNWPGSFLQTRRRWQHCSAEYATMTHRLKTAEFLG